MLPWYLVPSFRRSWVLRQAASTIPIALELPAASSTTNLQIGSLSTISRDSQLIICLKLGESGTMPASIFVRRKIMQAITTGSFCLRVWLRGSYLGLLYLRNHDSRPRIKRLISWLCSWHLGVQRSPYVP